jgi:DNA-binding NtrC family response regulator
MNHSWPGNVRHLQNAIESAVVMSGPDREIQPSALPEEILQPVVIAAVPERTPTTVMPAMPEEGINFVSAMSQVERELILTYLKRAGGNKRQAARMLSLSRTTLIDKLVRLGVAEPRISVVARAEVAEVPEIAEPIEAAEAMESMEMEPIEAVA